MLSRLRGNTFPTNHYGARHLTSGRHDHMKENTIIFIQILPRLPASYHAISRLGNLVTGFMISDESGNRFFPTAVTDYWQDRAGITYQQTYFSEFFPNLRTFSYLELSIKCDSAIRASMSSQKLHNMSIWLRLVSISSIRQLFHKQVHGSCLL